MAPDKDDEGGPQPPTWEDIELRKASLSAAISAVAVPADIVPMAQEFYNFLKGTTT